MGPHLAEIPVLTDTIVATAAIAADQLVGFDGAPTGAGAIPYGIAKTDAAIGDAVQLLVIGRRDLIAPAAIAAGDLVASDANAKPVTTADPTIAFARCVTGAANPNERCSIVLGR